MLVMSSLSINVAVHLPSDCQSCAAECYYDYMFIRIIDIYNGNQIQCIGYCSVGSGSHCSPDSIYVLQHEEGCSDWVAASLFVSFLSAVPRAFSRRLWKGRFLPLPATTFQLDLASFEGLRPVLWVYSLSVPQRNLSARRSSARSAATSPFRSVMVSCWPSR